ncbi:hypothetical protein AB1N83_003345 [Pleurotus pulmonarius]
MSMTKDQSIFCCRGHLNRPYVGNTSFSVSHKFPDGTALGQSYPRIGFLISWLLKRRTEIQIIAPWNARDKFPDRLCSELQIPSRKHSFLSKPHASAST